MNAREGIDLAKMAIISSLVCLLISSVLGSWYLLSDSETRYQRSMENAVSSTVMDRFYDFEEESTNATNEGDFERFPLVSSVAHALSEFNEDSLLYIYIRRVDTSGPSPVVNDKNLYTYAGLNGSEISGAIGDSSIKVHHSEVPTSSSVQQLLKYSKNRCSLSIAEAVYGPAGTDNGMSYVGIEVQILD